MVAESAYMIVFRLIHIISGVIWVGSVFLVVWYIQPGARALGPPAAPFMVELLGKRRLAAFLLWAGGTTIGAGLFLYWRDWQLAGSLGDWVGSTYGAVLTVGSVLALAAFLLGLLALKPTLDRIVARLSSGEGPPSPEGMAELQALQARARRLSVTALALLLVAVAAMATARYW
jgi:hypothetical protein